MRSKKRGLRWWAITGSLLLAGAIILVPAVVIAGHIIKTTIGSTTVIEHTDGSRQTIYWGDYPATSELDPQEILDGPTPEQGYADGQAMIAEIKSALSSELALEWNAAAEALDADVFFPGASNNYGGQSLLTTVNAPEHQSTSVPEAWAGKQKAMAVIGEISGKYGYQSPILDTDSWSEADLVAERGSLDPGDWVMVGGMVQGPKGQWLSFAFADYSKKPTGRSAKEVSDDAGGGAQSALFLSYGANGLLPAANRDIYKEALAPFIGLERPEPLES
ncbi:hypothetical protein GCM10009715_27450 [Paeniglutamicibacter psychrophenolicus]|uniref:Uncharacterized protein n=1 Tax=Paeniglutamicibacter psychrophenolicus TaxID=257454 RepID=A0ABS4WES7_9MICC|nr:hypothetical protein [Paeniglutamicibacter psychrophenolicus]MBP2374697.1 hypothetical protein [Paeniglutamicibacter psychrophenolicus]